MPENTQSQKVKEITDRLEAGIQELFNSEQYRTWLRTMSKFHSYSLNNTLLIAFQMPEATLVAGYTAWQKQFGRQVLKGEKVDGGLLSSLLGGGGGGGLLDGAMDLLGLGKK